MSRKFLAVVVVLALVVLVLFVYGRSRQRRRDEWVARAEAEQRAEEARLARWSSIDAALAAIRSADDAFSYVLFEDFLYALYAEAHFARGKPDGHTSWGAAGKPLVEPP